MKIASSVLKNLLLGFAAMVLTAGAAHAQATRTWVSGVGDDANPCSRTAPCKTFAGAISKTAAAGEINCLDAGGFGGVTITKSISIVCEGVTGGVLVSGTNGITVNVGATDRVLLQGLDIFGVGPALVSGVRIIGTGNVIIRKTTIQGFGEFGVELNGTANARVLIEQSMILGNKTGGVHVLGNGGSNFAFINNSLIDSNGPTSVTIASAGTVIISGSTLQNAAAALSISGGGTVTSYGDNVIRGTGTPTTTLPKS